VNQVVGIEPALKLIEMACQASHADIPIEFVEASAEAIPMKDRSIDTVVTTWTMSSIPDVDRAIMEARGGRPKLLRATVVAAIITTPRH
jgi:ubiquinone/menaquinone biosynthesis C-methylase UbiE